MDPIHSQFCFGERVLLLCWFSYVNVQNERKAHFHCAYLETKMYKTSQYQEHHNCGLCDDKNEGYYYFHSQQQFSKGSSVTIHYLGSRGPFHINIKRYILDKIVNCVVGMFTIWDLQPKLAIDSVRCTHAFRRPRLGFTRSTEFRADGTCNRFQVGFIRISGLKKVSNERSLI